MIITKAEVAVTLRIDENDIPDTLFNNAEKEVEKLIGKRYSELTENRTFKLSESQEYLELKHSNINSIITFTVDDVDIDEDDYDLYGEEGVIHYTFLANEEIHLVYTYANDIADATEKILVFLLVFRDVLLIRPDLITKELVSEKIGDYTVTYNVAELKLSPDRLKKRIDELKEELNDFLDIL